MREEWKSYDLPESMVVNGNEYSFFYDFKHILEVMKPLNDPDLLDEEKVDCALYLFFGKERYGKISPLDYSDCVIGMMYFISGNKYENDGKQEKSVMDWEKDISIIIAPINRIAGTDVRRDNNLHWWTFLSYFMEIGECTLSSYVGIRDKLNKKKKLSKEESEFYKKNKKDIDLKQKYDSITELMKKSIEEEIKAEIMAVRR